MDRIDERPVQLEGLCHCRGAELGVLIFQSPGVGGLRDRSGLFWESESPATREAEEACQ